MIVAARDVFEDSIKGIHGAIEGASPDTLNARPAGPNTNSIAVLAVHSMHSTRWWLSVAAGAPIPERDRPSEFLVVASGGDELRTTVDEMAQDCRRLLDPQAALDLGALRESGTRNGEPVSVAWAMLHAIEHLREHVSHMLLTRQVLDANGR